MGGMGEDRGQAQRLKNRFSEAGNKYIKSTGQGVLESLQEQ